jgi:hypothetical protein
MATLVRTDQIQNPYKFSVYRNAALTSNNTPTAVAMDAKTFDTGTNVDVVTNKGRFTAPVAGFYFFTAQASNTAATSTLIQSFLYKNGSVVKDGQGLDSALNGGESGGGVSGLLQLAANDYVEHYFVGSSGSTMAVGASKCYFDGFLISAT